MAKDDGKGRSADADPDIEGALARAVEQHERLLGHFRQAQRSVSSLLRTEEERHQIEASLREALLELGEVVLERYLRGQKVEEKPSVGWLAEPTEVDMVVDVGVEADLEDDLRETKSHPAVKRVEVTAEHVGRLSKGMGPSFRESEPSRELRIVADVLPRITSELGRAKHPIKGFAEAMGEIGTLDHATKHEELEAWAMLPDEVQVCLAGTVAARLRHLQEESDPETRSVVHGDDRIRRIFGRLSTHMDLHRPGFAHGLAREHTPQTSTWQLEAQERRRELDELVERYCGKLRSEQPRRVNPEVALSELDRLLEAGSEPEEVRDFLNLSVGAGLTPEDPRLVRRMAPYADLLTGSQLRRLRSAIAAAQQSDEASEADDESTGEGLPDEWAWREKVKRSRIVLIGGDRRPQAMARIQEVFEPAAFEWPSLEYNAGIRTVQAWAERVAQGSVDIVLLLAKHASHTVTGAIVEAAKKSPVEIVFLHRGYGVEQIRQGIEAFVAPE